MTKAESFKKKVNYKMIKGKESIEKKFIAKILKDNEYDVDKYKIN